MHLVKYKKFFNLFVLFSVYIFAQDISANKIQLPKPYDKTGHALDIIIKKDVIRDDYGAKLYLKHCASCHGKDRAGKDRAPQLSASTLKAFETISQLYLYIQKGCPKSGTNKPQKLDSIKLIFISRHIKKPLKKK